MAPDDGSQTTERDIDTGLEGLRRQVEDNLARNHAWLGGRHLGGQRAGRVLRRTQEGDGDSATPTYAPREPWWRGRRFLLVSLVLAAIVPAWGLGFFPGSDDGPDDTRAVLPALVEATTTTIPTTTTAISTTTTPITEPLPTTAVATTVALVAAAPPAPPPPPPPPPTTVPPPRVATTIARVVTTTRPPTTVPPTTAPAPTTPPPSAPLPTNPDPGPEPGFGE